MEWIWKNEKYCLDVENDEKIIILKFLLVYIYFIKYELLNWRWIVMWFCSNIIEWFCGIIEMCGFMIKLKWVVLWYCRDVWFYGKVKVLWYCRDGYGWFVGWFYWWRGGFNGGKS